MCMCLDIVIFESVQQLVCEHPCTCSCLCVCQGVSGSALTGVCHLIIQAVSAADGQEETPMKDAAWLTLRPSHFLWVHTIVGVLEKSYVGQMQPAANSPSPLPLSVTLKKKKNPPSDLTHRSSPAQRQYESSMDQRLDVRSPPLP